MLNRSMPSTAGATISIPPERAVSAVFQREVQSLDEEHNLQCSREVYQIWILSEVDFWRSKCPDLDAPSSLVFQLMLILALLRIFVVQSH